MTMIENRHITALIAASIKQCDVKPSYTNIAVLGGGVCSAAGELSGDAELLNYGRERLERVVAHAAFHPVPNR